MIRATLLITTLIVCQPLLVAAQGTGRIIGYVSDAATGAPLSGAQVRVLDPPIIALTGLDGRFVLAGVPAGEREIRVEHLGHRPTVVERVQVRSGQATEVRIPLQVAPVAVPGVEVQASRLRLIEPEVITTHEVVAGREVRRMPIDRLGEVIELAPGVSGGHFRGGRLGQDIQLIDGLALKNAFEASAQVPGLELAPSAIEEVEVITGGFGAEHGSALSGVVSYVTRRGRNDRWGTRGSLFTDQWAPNSLFHGFTALSLSAGGPLRMLGPGATLFADVLVQGMVDADPRSRGLTCLQPDDADPTLGDLMRELDQAAPGLRCPHPTQTIPQQHGDKFIAFARFDRPIGSTRLTVTALRNRHQQELYTPEFRYHPDQRLGRRTLGTLATAALDWTHPGAGYAWHATGRAAWSRIDRYLGALDPASVDDRTSLAGFGLSGFRFLGESFVKTPIAEQLASGQAVPGYVAPGGGVESPFGPAAQGLFFTEGTPDLVGRALSDLFAFDAMGERLSAGGSAVRAGASLKFYSVESYERTLSHLPGSSPTYALFYPASVASFVDARLGAPDEITLSAGIRIEAFRSGIDFRADRGDFLSPVIDTKWKIGLMPRFGVAMPLPGSEGRTAFRLNYTYVAQPPDFRVFLDSTIGDSLRADLRRQGNPDLSFEQGRSYEVGVSHLLSDALGMSVSAFRKDLTRLVTGTLRLSQDGLPQYSTNDFGKVTGLEISLRGEWRSFAVRMGYALQKAVGISSGTDSDSVPRGDAARIERPLAFDRRHSADVVVSLGGAAGTAVSRASLVLLAQAHSGYPIDRIAAAGDTVLRGSASYLPWGFTADARATYDIGAIPGCTRCLLRVGVDGRNLLGRDNIVALRRETGLVAPSRSDIERIAALVAPPAQPIPAESPIYNRRIDTNSDGLITADEFRRARQAAALDRFDPSLFFGEARQLRVGVEVMF
jgi:hypothetical protein